MASWKLSLVAGLVVGGLLTTAVWHRSPSPSPEEFAELQIKNKQLTTEKAAVELKLEQHQTQSALEIEQLRTELKATQQVIDDQKIQFEKQIAALTTEQKTLVVKKKKLDTQVVKLTSTAEQQKAVLNNSKVLYQQQLELQKQINAAKLDVKKAQQVAAEFKQACDEFKSGTGWNWVSQADCDKYDARLKVVEDEQAQLAALEQELDSLNQRIEIEIPRPK
ncbi:chromosome segregation ATPase [Photobacterium sp. ZSDE20]|uniref:Chromosome segregation ATPase n=1 Tax=Photobacterium pectinilyticum TaxID=2906793 RepID=A0ABT1N3E2_9GAMM|nr:chromosome segregation ATPase [Photobacterium sp. ZSDE20]MCQ1059239.1 chromosome segregation ATPase [Photobacterium sp. ZSDE20]MDD1824528.1 chromosome segregation ATPase [Photobacterium sp. ZSDE20]